LVKMIALICLALVAAVNCQNVGEFILVPDLTGSTIYNLNVESGTSTPAIVNQQRPVAIAYDQTAGLVFWTDITVNALKSANLDGTNEFVIYRMPVPSTSDGMAVSPADSLIIYSDTGANVIGAINYDGTGQRSILTTDLNEPRAIAIDSSIRTFFYTDWGYTPARLGSANYDDGSARTVIINTAIVWPNGMTIDTTAQKIFWADSNLGTVDSANYDGSERTTLVSMRQADRLFGIAVDDSWIYLSGWGVRTVNKYPRDGSSNTPTIVSTQVLGQAGGLAIGYVAASNSAAL
jgi:sugar lactone lactonase YvrE